MASVAMLFYRLQRPKYISVTSGLQYIVKRIIALFFGCKLPAMSGIELLNDDLGSALDTIDIGNILNNLFD